MKLKKILVVYKRSTFDLYHNEEFDHNVKKLIDEDHISVKHLKNSHDTHQITVNTIIDILKNTGAHLDVIFRGELKPVEDYDSYDLVVTTGGDGTILETSKYIKNTPILGVNSDPEGSVGFFAGASKEDFQEKIQMILDDSINKKYITRIQIKLNGEPVRELVMNDILITHGIPAATSRYIIRLNDKEEIHRSSGLWVSTAAGSTAAIRSAGGIPLPVDSKNIQYIIREFYDRGSKNYSLLGGVCDFSNNLQIISQMRLGRFYIDGPFFEFPFTVGDILTFHESEYPLLLLGFEKAKRDLFIKSHINY